MGRIVVTEYLSLDGVMEAPQNWHFPYLSDDMMVDTRAHILSSKIQLLGRVTYEEFAAVWPSMTNNEFGFADKLNTMPKFVVSSSLQKAEWHNSSLIKANIVEEISHLKQHTNGIIAITGSSALVQSLMQADLIDEYRLLLHPVVVGTGKRLFKEGLDTTPFKLTQTKTYQLGVVALTYQSA